MRRSAPFGALVAGWLVLGAVAGLAAGGNPPLTTAELLVDLARDHALRQQGRQIAADVQHIRALLRGAVRLDPTLVDAYVWLCELATLEGDQAEALRLLTALLEAQPAHEGAFGRWLVAGAQAQQTAEKRVEWLESVAAVPRPPALEAMVRVALARLAQQRMEPAAARRDLARALELEPASLEAAWLGLQLVDRDAPPEEGLRAALNVLQLAPQSVAVAGQVAGLLDAYGFTEDAARFYEHALAVGREEDPWGAPPAGLLLGLARNLLARGELEAAIEHTREAINADLEAVAEAALFLHYLLKRNDPEAAAAVGRQLASRFAAIRDPAEHPVNELAQAAWFYATIEPQPDRALMLAATAAERAPRDPFIQRVLGWTQALNLKPDEARQTLRPIAGRDPYAAYMLARLLREAGEEGEARRVIELLDPKPRAGPAFDLLRDAGMLAATQPAGSQPAAEPAGTEPTSRSASAPAARRYAEMARALAGFDTRVLEFHRNPGQFLEAQVALENRSLAPGEPWWAVFTLTNGGPFPITLGPDAMVNPVFLLSFSVEGDGKRDFQALLTVSLDQHQVLHPGQAARVRRTLDVGPLRRVARWSPQQAQRITLRALLDGVLGADREWRTSPGGQELEPVYFNRLPVSTSAEATTSLCSAVAEGALPDRVQALELMAELIGERQRADLKRLGYRPAPVATERMQAALLDSLSSDSWEIRARTLDALQVMGLDRRMVEAAERCLEHEHWLVRLMAVRLLARQGEGFRERAVSISRNDADELVRAVADSYVQKWGSKE